MHQKTKDIQLRYQGFLQTPVLWNNSDVFGLHQFKIPLLFSRFNDVVDEKIRLGKYIERFVAHELNQHQDVNILCENVQIQQNKRTLGELDCILKKGETTIHLEIVYKFYLYDPSFGTDEISCFIGPNRKDTLHEKLTKLKDKQLPVLYSDYCRPLVESLGLTIETIVQRVYFKAQLFLPYSQRNDNLKILNNDCISGVYLTKKELNVFTDCKFYIPIKKDWLLNPHVNVNWLLYREFKKQSDIFLERKFSPLCWMKEPNGKIIKFFLVWW